MAKRNQKHMLPRLTNGRDDVPRSFPVSRGAFLNNDLRVYYGPGQDPDVGAPGKYAPPTDWMTAGSPLRVPQVAWLTVSIHDFFDRHTTPTPFTVGFWFAQIPYPAFQTWLVGETDNGTVEGGYGYTVESTALDGTLDSVTAFGAAFSDGSYHYSYAPDPDGPTISVNHDGEVEIYTHTIPNPYIDHYQSILEMYEAVKEAIEAIRPNRTWVEVWEPWSESLTDNRNYFQGLEFDDAVWWHMVCPQDSGTWFGTDFLHIFSGSACTTFNGPEFDYTDNDNILDIEFYQQSFDALKDVMARDGDAPDRFRDFAIRVYGVQVTIEDFPPYSPTIPDPGGHPSFSVNRTYYTGPLFFGTRHDDSVGVPWSVKGDSTTWPDRAAHIQTIEQAQLNEQNTAHATRDNASRELLQRSCEHMDANGIDAKYLGTTQTMDAGSLIALIASHFKFDPDTGADLDSD